MRKIQFEKYNNTDFQTYFNLVKDSEVMKYIKGRGLTEDEANHKFTSFLEQNTKHNNLGVFKVHDTENDTFIGNCKIVHSKHLENALEIGYILKKEFWKQGIGSQICEHLIDTAKTYFPEKEVMAVIDPDNIASKKLLEKFNFETYWTGIEYDMPTEKLIRKRL